jgi:chemotaxis-related protein WspB
MLFVVFQLGDHRYAIDAAQVAEILPLVSVKPIPQAPHGVAGVFNYRGAPVPVIDLSKLTLGRPAQQRLSTRIIVVDYNNGRGDNKSLGLIAEKAMETVRLEPSEFLPTGVSSARNGYLGPVATDSQGLLQRVEIKKLLPSEVRAALFREIREAHEP